MLRAVIAACLLLALGAGGVAADVIEANHYDSLAAMTQDADAVVLGRVVEAVPGRVFSGCGYTAATVEVEQVLAGHLPSASQKRLSLEYFGFCTTPLPQLGKEIPAERAVFFLYNKGLDLSRLRPSATASEIAHEAAFWGLVILAGTAVDLDGRVHVPQTLSAPFLAKLEGTSFAQFVGRVRSLAAGAPNTATVPLPAQGDSSSAATVPLAVGLVAFFTIVLLGPTRRRARASLFGLPATEP